MALAMIMHSYRLHFLFSLSNTSRSARTLRSMLCEGLKMDWKRKMDEKTKKAKTKWIASIVCDCLDAHKTRKPTSVALRIKKNQCIFRGRGSGIGVGNAFVVSQPDMHITLMNNTISAPQSFALCKIVHVACVSSISFRGKVFPT